MRSDVYLQNKYEILSHFSINQVVEVLFFNPSTRRFSSWPICCSVSSQSVLPFLGRTHIVPHHHEASGALGAFTEIKGGRHIASTAGRGAMVDGHHVLLARHAPRGKRGNYMDPCRETLAFMNLPWLGMVETPIKMVTWGWFSLGFTTWYWMMSEN